MLRWAFASLSLGLAGCSLLLDFDEPVEPGETIDGGSPDAGPDGAPGFDADVTPDASTAANCAASEPNDSLGAAATISPGTIQAAICPDLDGDFYSFALVANSDLSITLDFLNDLAPGDLNLRLYDAADAVVSLANGTGTTDQILHSPGMGNALPGGNYRIEVFPAVQNVSKDYNLTLAITIAP